MTRALAAERRSPRSGEVRAVVVFLHGYGANGADLIGLADVLADHLPDTLFLAPDAPERMRAGVHHAPGERAQARWWGSANG